MVGPCDASACKDCGGVCRTVGGTRVCCCCACGCGIRVGDDEDEDGGEGEGEGATTDGPGGGSASSLFDSTLVFWVKLMACSFP
jgi:hypothetical protein